MRSEFGSLSKWTRVIRLIHPLSSHLLKAFKPNWDRLKLLTKMQILLKIPLEWVKIPLLSKAMDALCLGIINSKLRRNYARAGLKLKAAHMETHVHSLMVNMSSKKRNMFLHATKLNFVSNFTKTNIAHTVFAVSSFTHRNWASFFKWSMTMMVWTWRIC